MGGGTAVVAPGETRRGGLDIGREELDLELVIPGREVMGAQIEALGVVSQGTERVGELLALPLSTYAVLARGQRRVSRLGRWSSWGMDELGDAQHQTAHEPPLRSGPCASGHVTTFGRFMPSIFLGAGPSRCCAPKRYQTRDDLDHCR